MIGRLKRISQDYFYNHSLWVWSRYIGPDRLVRVEFIVSLPLMYMCSLSAVYFDTTAMKKLLYLATSGKNRGDEAAGFCVRSGDRYILTKATRKDGDVSAAYNELISLVDGDEVTAGIAQTRYSTRGPSDAIHSQPFEIDGKHKIFLGHNGTVANAKQLANRYGFECTTESDTEVIGKLLSDADSVYEGVKSLVKEAIGAYNLTVLDEDGVLTVLKDPLGFHPLWWGRGKNGEFYVASEDSALYSIGCFEPEELLPGEMIQVSEDGIKKHMFVNEKTAKCAFEAFYFMKPGSSYDGRLVQDIRHELGYLLGKKETMISENGIVVPVLDSGDVYGKGYSKATGMPIIRGALMRNREGRVYMDPGIKDEHGLKLTRKEKAKLKHVPIPRLVRGKDIYLLDDSIVRSDTSFAITESLGLAGANSIHWRIAFPQIRCGCIYGHDHSRKAELISARLELEEEIAKQIGADSVKFLKMDDMPLIFGDISNNCFACADGNYPTDVPEECRSAIEF